LLYDSCKICGMNEFDESEDNQWVK
jgi:hypothetical protein